MSAKTSDWCPIPVETVVGNGGRAIVYHLIGDSREKSIDLVKGRLHTKWGMPSECDNVFELVGQRLSEMGYSLPDIASARGDWRSDLTASQKIDILRKERADICEVIAGMAQEQIRDIEDSDVFLVLRHKVTIAVSEHGIDYIAFKFDQGNTEPMPNENEAVILGESKYTSAERDLQGACGATRAWIVERLINKRIWTELTNLANEYRQHNQDWKADRVRGFIPSIYARDAQMVLSTTVLYSDSVEDSRAISDLKKSILQALDSHTNGSIPHERFEALLFKVVDIDMFCESCYEGFRNGTD